MQLGHAQGDAIEGVRPFDPDQMQTNSDLMQTNSDLMPYDEGVRSAQLSFGQPLTKEGIRYQMLKIIHAVGVGELDRH